MGALCRVELLGGLRVRLGDREITRFRSQKAAALLAYLAYHRDNAHPREILIELLWPWSAVSAGRNRLNVELSSLRRQLEPPGVPRGAVVLSDRASVQLNPEAVTTDVAELEDALGAAQRSKSALERAQWWTVAVETYGGLLLPGHYEEWVLPEQERLALSTSGQLRPSPNR